MTKPKIMQLNTEQDTRDLAVFIAPLLRPGDRIVAPSGHAASVIVWLEPRLEPFVRVVGHPIPGQQRCQFPAANG